MADTMKANGGKREVPSGPAQGSVPDGPISARTSEHTGHYHSYFISLLSWKDPRASGIAYASVVACILAARYLDVIRWALRLSYMALGATVAAEVAGKMLLNNGLTSQLRPRKYHQVSRETIDTLLGDVGELVNFFFVEAQRILYVENIGASAAAFVATFLSYYLVKVVPYWVLAILGTTVAFAAPLVYTANKELIDSQLKNASDVVNAQTAQLRSAAGKHTSHVTDLTKQYMGDYSAKAQSMIRGSAASPAGGADKFPSAPTHQPSEALKESDFPSAPAGDVTKEADGEVKTEAGPQADGVAADESLI